MNNDINEDRRRRKVIFHANLSSILFLYFISVDMMKNKTK